MDSTFLLILLLVLPVAAAAVIVVVSVGRRRGRTADDCEHRLQAGTAAEQDAAAPHAAGRPRAVSARERRAASAVPEDQAPPGR